MKKPEHSKSDGKQLNVVFHGLWAYRVADGRIDAYTIQDKDHRFLGGAWMDEEAMAPGDYELSGVTPGEATEFSDQENPVVRTNNPLDESNKYCKISLPLPREIHSKRKFPTGNTPGFGGADAVNIRPAEISMVHVLVYDFDDLDELDVTGLDWTPEMNEDGRTANLHFFAQEDQAVDPDHYIGAYISLANSFGLDIRPLRTATVPVDDPTGIDGLQPEEEGDLIERNPEPQGSSGGNCENLVVYSLGDVAA